MKLRLVLIAGLSLLVAGCSTYKVGWDWPPIQKKPKPAPEIVHEVELVNADGTPASYPQTWKRNTLLIDLTGVRGTGAVTARLPAETTWPVRVAVRVRPGSVEQIEVVGEERNVTAVAREGLTPIDLEFPPSVFRPTTQAIYISWGYQPQFAEVVVEPEAGFVSPTEVPKTAPTPAAPATPSEEAAAPGANAIITPAEAAPQEPGN